VTLGIVCGCAAAALLISIVVILWFRSRRRRQKLLNDLTCEFGSDESKSTKSAPASRNASPKFNKRMSCPDALAVSRGGRNILVRSLASHRVPDFTLPPERVQPCFNEKRGPTNISIPHSSSFGSLAPDLYHHQSYSEDDETALPETAHGRLWFSVVHDPSKDQLHVTLIKIKDLPGRVNNRYPRDPFVKIFLLPDDRTHRVSKVKKKSLSPVFNETHSFQVSAEDVKKRTLKFSVYDVDKRRVRHCLGHVKVTLKSLDLAKGEVMCSDLEPMVQPVASLGELQFSLAFIPSAEKIKVGIHRAKNLTFMEDYPDMGVYVRVQLHFGHRCHRIKRTIARQGEPDMTFNESVSFSVASKQMDSCSLVISLMLTSSHLYSAAEVEHGRVVVGSFMYSRGEELVHWQEMMSQPKVATTRWHCLTNVSSSP
ncbi:unnamed protein product, partial [Candidula unifasciata]